MSDRLDLKVGDKIRHIKRGTGYLIIGRALFARELFDGDIGVMWNVDGGSPIITHKNAVGGRVNLALQVSFQRSILHGAPIGISYRHALVYQSLDTDAIYARPEYEFTADRFEGPLR